MRVEKRTLERRRARAEAKEQNEREGQALLGRVHAVPLPYRTLCPSHVRPADPASSRSHFSCSDLRGADLIRAGIADLSAGIESVAALLAAVGAPRLRQLGLEVPAAPASPEHRLYALLARDDSDTAHTRDTTRSSAASSVSSGRSHAPGSDLFAEAVIANGGDGLN
jgi:hypothetical protein